MRAAKTMRILGLASLMALGAMVQSAAAQSDALRLAALVPTGQAVLLARGEVAIAAPGQGRVLIIDSMGNARVLAGTGALGFSGDGGPATAARLSSPSSLVADGAGNVYIADTGNNRIRRIDALRIITTVAGSTDEAGFDGDGAQAVLASLDSPSGLAFDPAGNLYVADTGNNRIRRIDPQGIMTTVAGIGEAGFDGDGVAALSARLNGPTGLAFDAVRGRLLVADTGNHVVRSLEADGTLWTVAGSNRPGFSGDGGPATEARLVAPTGVGVGAQGQVFIADTGNHRVRWISPRGSIESVDSTVETPLRAVLAAPTLTKRIAVTSPGAGASWQVGTVRLIQWTTTRNLADGSGGPLAVELSRDGGLTWQLLRQVSSWSVSIPWTVSGPSNSAAMFRVRSTWGSPVFGLSTTFPIWTVE